MTDRYFVETAISFEGPPGHGGAEQRVILAGAEAHHLIHVMRGRPGDRVTLFDGSGAEFVAEIRSAERSRVELVVLAREMVDRELPQQVTLGVALPKGDRQKWLVEKSVELGVERLVPLLTARAVAQPTAQSLARLHRAVIEASKQCGRNRLMEIAEPLAWPEYVATGGESAYRLLAHPGTEHQPAGPPPRRTGLHPVPQSHDTASQPGDPILLAVGPEGGFTDEEAASAVAAGWRTVDLGPRILRVDTAALVMMAMVTQPRIVDKP